MEFFSVFYRSGFFLAVKIFISIYVTVLLADIILLLILRGLDSDFRVGLKGMDIPTTPKNKTVKQWGGIKDRLKSGNTSQYKAAILEADKMADKILAGIGYKGDNMGERLEKANQSQIDNLEELKKAHELRNRVIYEKNFAITKKEAKEAIDIYGEFLETFEII